MCSGAECRWFALLEVVFAHWFDVAWQGQQVVAEKSEEQFATVMKLSCLERRTT